MEPDKNFASVSVNHSARVNAGLYCKLLRKSFGNETLMEEKWSKKKYQDPANGF